MAKLKNDELAQIAIEISGIIGTFSKDALLKGYFSSAITKDLFNSEEEYEDFFKILGQYMHNINTSDLFDNTVRENQVSVDPIIETFIKLYEKYTAQVEALMLESAYEIKDTVRLKHVLGYFKNRDVVSKKMVIAPYNNDNDYYRTIGMLSSKTIISYIPTVKYTETEKQFYEKFLTSEFARKAFDLLHPEDIAYSVNDKRFMGSAYFSALTIWNLEGETQDSKYDKLAQYLKGEIKNFDIEKLKWYMFYRYYDKLRSQEENITIQELKFLEEARQYFSKVLNGSFQKSKAEFDMPKLNSCDFEVVSAFTGLPYKEEEKKVSKMSALQINFTPPSMDMINKSPLETLTAKVTAQTGGKDYPIIICTDDSSYSMENVILDKECISFSKGEFATLIEQFILDSKLKMIIECGRNNNSLDEYLSKTPLNDETVKRMKTLVSELEILPEELQDVEFDILNYLIDKKLFKFNLLLEYDINLVCDGFLSGKIPLENIKFEKIKNTIDKTRLLEASIQSSELLSKLIESQNIYKKDLFTLELSSYTKLTETLFNEGMLTLEDIIKLFELNRITINDLKNMSLENLQIEDNDIVSVYCEIQKKKNEYEKFAKTKYEEAINQGINEEDIIETEEEKQLQSDLQKLINLKNIYITLFKKQKLTSLESYHRTTDIYNEIVDSMILEDDFDKNISEITNMLYEDNFISMAQVRDLDDSLCIEILKSGSAKKEDIDNFKNEIVSLDEVDKFRQELSQNLSGEELEQALREKVYILTYNRLYDLMDRISEETDSTKEEKLSLLYSIFSKNNITEKTHREFFEAKILVKIYGKLKNKSKQPIIKLDEDDELLDDDLSTDEVIPNPSKTHKQFVYPTNIIWDFIELLDSEYTFKILSDGYVLFESKRLNKVFIENMWQANREGDFIRRGYGTSTIILDLDTYKKHKSEIIKPSRHGYKVDVFKAKSHLPKIKIEDKEKVTGLIVHEKDLKNTGKKVWFELILDHLGITQENINNKKTNYTSQELDEINKFIRESKFKYEEIDK